MRMLLVSAIAGLLASSVGAPRADAQQPAAPQPPVQQAAAQQPAAQGIAAHQPIAIADFVKDDSFDLVKLSPDAKYVARSVNIGEKTVLVVQQRVDGKITGHFNLGGKTQVRDFWWVNDHRLLISMGEKFGLLERPQATGEIYAMNADGGGQDLLVGWRAVDENKGSHITVAKKQELVGAELIPGWHKDPDKVLVSVWDFGGGAYTRVEEMNVDSGRRSPVTRVPVQNAGFVVDAQGVVRMAMGEGVDNLSKTYYRDGDGAEWQLINDESASSHRLDPLGFSADGHTAYFEQEEAKGPDAIYAFDVATHKMQSVLRDPVADPGRTLHGPKHEVIGFQYFDGKPHTVFLDENGSLARLYHSLEASFPDQSVVLENFTSDGNIALVFTYSDRSPGDYYLFDMVNKKAAHLISHRDWIDPDRMGIERPISFTSRDGVAIHGYLTLPPGSDGKNLPMVVNPHGGPIGVEDEWGFNGEVQLLASRGYAVLQVNYRGSNGYGRDFLHSGYKQWGGKMVDDVTDATQWAIKQGIADSRRVCIYGASYGGYAALMGVAREPSLYRCAIGYVGVYDMPAMYSAGDISDHTSGKNFLKETLGDQNLESISPDHLAARITVPVMMVAGHEDVRAPPKHTELMRDALLKAGKQVDAKIYGKEGHGFFIEADREDFYARMLDFLGHNIGASAVTTH